MKILVGMILAATSLMATAQEQPAPKVVVPLPVIDIPSVPRWVVQAAQMADELIALDKQLSELKESFKIQKKSFEAMSGRRFVSGLANGALERSVRRMTPTTALGWLGAANGTCVDARFCTTLNAIRTEWNSNSAGVVWAGVPNRNHEERNIYDRTREASLAAMSSARLSMEGNDVRIRALDTLVTSAGGTVANTDLKESVDANTRAILELGYLLTEMNSQMAQQTYLQGVSAQNALYERRSMVRSAKASQ